MIRDMQGREVVFNPEASEDAPPVKADRKEEFLTTNKLWVLLDIALEDATSLRANPKFRFNMDRWVWNERLWRNEDNEGDRLVEVCEVCLAGSVLVNTFGRRDNISPDNLFELPDKLRVRCRAVDELRCGRIHRAYETLLERPVAYSAVGAVQYEVNKIYWTSVPETETELNEFFAGMTNMRDKLKAANI